jgi:hypothetical protein
MSNPFHRALGAFFAVSILAAASVVSASGTASAGRTDEPDRSHAHHCVNEFGVDYNNLYRVRTQFRTFECRVIHAREPWIPLLVWITHDFSEDIYPPGYIPWRPAPMADFLAKLKRIKVVVDGGTEDERTYFFKPRRVVRTDINAEQVNPGLWGAPYPMASMLPRMPGMRVGQYTFEPILVLRAEHCDGFGPDPELQCLPAGEVSFGVRPLDITKRPH